MKDISVVFPEFARKLVAEDLGCEPSEVYVVWFSKTLQNTKAMLSSDVPNAKGKYYEATYNGDKKEVYLDKYNKEFNKKYDFEI